MSQLTKEQFEEIIGKVIKRQTIDLKAYIKTYTDDKFGKLKSYTDQKFNEMQSYTDQKFDELAILVNKGFNNERALLKSDAAQRDQEIGTMRKDIDMIKGALLIP